MNNTVREVTASSSAFRPISESSSGLLPSHQPIPPSPEILFLPKRPGNVLMTPLELRISMRSGDHTLWAGARRQPILHGSGNRYKKKKKHGEKRARSASENMLSKEHGLVTAATIICERSAGRAPAAAAAYRPSGSCLGYVSCYKRCCDAVVVNCQKHYYIPIVLI
ncbi:hypothetical protein EVAR_25115_1 [Eumeta japonica]|uniref:Uncharacterized protein n=1 Tax=Eumeta variegata TaxID=151549 RepID=A0A4C1XN37_EUMVA|nr:hypothetical protein EVAR_25115_1 [Eumeta japonica]